MRGAANDLDPDWLVMNTTNEEIELWLMDLASNLHLSKENGRNGFAGPATGLFTQWEKDFHASVNKQYDERTARGFTEKPLSGKQLVFLKRLWKRLAASTLQILDNGAP